MAKKKTVEQFSREFHEREREEYEKRMNSVVEPVTEPDSTNQNESDEDKGE